MKDYIEDKILQKIEQTSSGLNYSRVIPTKVVDQLYDTLRVYGSGYFRLYFSTCKNPYGDGDYHNLISSYLLKENKWINFVSNDSSPITIYLSISEAREYKLNRLLPMLLN